MIDWFVLLGAAIALVPIVLLFAFAGCVLDREGKLPPPTNFSYQIGLEEIDTIEITLMFTLDTGNTTATETVEDVNPEGGALELKGALLESEGTVSCICTLTTKTEPPFDEEAQTFSASKTVNKEEDELLPDFKLSRDGQGGFLVE